MGALSTLCDLVLVAATVGVSVAAALTGLIFFRPGPPTCDYCRAFPSELRSYRMRARARVCVWLPSSCAWRGIYWLCATLLYTLLYTRASDSPMKALQLTPKACLTGCTYRPWRHWSPASRGVSLCEPNTLTQRRCFTPRLLYVFM